MTRSLVLSLLIVTLIIGIGIGFMLSSGYEELEMQREHSSNLGKADSKYDLRFIDAMIAHHETAIEMAKDAQKKSTRNEILDLANSIITDQSKEIKTLEHLRQLEYGIINN